MTTHSDFERFVRSTEQPMLSPPGAPMSEAIQHVIEIAHAYDIEIVGPALQ